MKHFTKAQKPNPKNYSEIGSYLKDCRRYCASRSKNRSEFSQKRVAIICELTSPQYISNIERNIIMPSPKIAVILSELYGIKRKTIYEFFMVYRRQQYEACFLKCEA